MGRRKYKKYLSNDFVIEAYNQKKYAFVSDYVRLRILYDYGGVYLDTDMVVKQNFDGFLMYKTFWGRMYSNAIGTSIIGCESRNDLIKEMIDYYDSGKINMKESNNRFITRFFVNKFTEFSAKNILQILGNNNILLPTYYFYLPALFKKRFSFSEHLFINSWTKENRNITLRTYIPTWITSTVRNRNGKKRFKNAIDYSGLNEQKYRA